MKTDRSYRLERQTTPYGTAAHRMQRQISPWSTQRGTLHTSLNPSWLSVWVSTNTRKYSITLLGWTLTHHPLVLVHAARRKVDERDASAYGIATDGEDWKFHCVNHNTKVRWHFLLWASTGANVISKFSWISLGWHVKKKKIVLLLDRILDQLATLSWQLTVSQETGKNISDSRRCGFGSRWRQGGECVDLSGFAVRVSGYLLLDLLQCCFWMSEALAILVHFDCQWRGHGTKLN